MRTGEAARELPTLDEQRVRVWFGRHAIADYRAEPALAERYAVAMRRPFVGLRVTVERSVPRTGDSS
jgi:hypothetical protein